MPRGLSALHFFNILPVLLGRVLYAAWLYLWKDMSESFFPWHLNDDVFGLSGRLLDLRPFRTMRDLWERQFQSAFQRDKQMSSHGRLLLKLHAYLWEVCFWLWVLSGSAKLCFLWGWQLYGQRAMHKGLSWWNIPSRIDQKLSKLSLRLLDLHYECLFVLFCCQPSSHDNWSNPLQMCLRLFLNLYKCV